MYIKKTVIYLSSKFDFLNDIDIVFVHKCNNLIIKMFNS